MANKPTIKSFYADSGTIGDGITDANVITLSGTADANATVNVYDGSTLLGSAKTNGSGVWLFETPKLSDSAHGLTATATDASGTSAASAAMAVTVVPSVTDFRPASDNWQNPIKIDGQGWFIESPNKAWSVTNPDPHTVRMEVRPGDEWADDGTARSEILTVTNAEDHQVFNASYTMTIEPGQINNVAWLSLTQMHEDAGIPFSIQLVNDHMTVLTDQNADFGTLAYSDPNAIVRGHAYDIQIRANFSTDSTGFLQIWRDGVQIVDYHGQLGSETGGQYLKLGIYEGWPENVSSPTAVDYSNIVVQYNNPNVATPSAPGNTTPPPVTTPPTTPAIANFSTDSGVAGDHITNDSTLTLTGSAIANSTVKVFDGSTQVGTATADANGAWSVTTSTLANGGHSLTATATNSAGTSSASTALSVTIDTAAPSAPTLAASTPTSTNVEVLTGAAEANSTVKVFDGTTQIGTATANGNGAWTYTTAALSTGSHSFTAKAMDVAGNTGAASAAAVVNVAAPTAPAPSAPTIASFSNDSGVVGDRITNDSTLNLTGTAAANSTVKVFDGTTQIGTANANGNGQWTYTTQALNDGGHNLTATARDALGQTSVASSTLALTIDTHAPVAPTMSVYSQAGSAVGSTTILDDLVLKGTAEANSTIRVFDGSTQIGIATTNGSGTWNFDTGHLDAGSHSFASTAVDAAGNIGFASASATVGITSPPTSVPPAVPTTPAITPTDPAITVPSGSSNFVASAGNDKISFNFKLTDATVSFSGNHVIVDGPDGSHTVLTGFNTYVFTDGTVNEKDGDPLVDDLFYYSHNHDVWNAHVDADQHYHQYGWHEGRDPDAFFSTSFYLSLNQDVKQAGVDPLVHFHQSGWQEGRQPSAAFDDAAYLAANPDVAAAHIDPLAHFLQLGEAEGRQPTTLTSLIGPHGFDYVYYLQHNPDVQAAEVDPFQHYENFGWKEGRDPNALFDTNGYLAANPDVAKAQINPLDHYDQSGWKEGRDPSPALDTSDYLSHYRDVAAAGIDPLVQYLQYGIHEGRQSFGHAISGSTGNDVLKSTPNNDLFVGNGGQDTFVFAANFGHDVIKDFAASGGTTHDVVQFSKTVFDSFASVLSHATQFDSDVLISAGSDTLLLKNTKLGALDSSDFRFA